MPKTEDTTQKQHQPVKIASPDKGPKYELSGATLIAAILSANEEVENYHVFLNLKEAHPFDDVVAKVQFKGRTDSYAFAIQMKHLRKGETINVEKYLEGYRRIVKAGGLSSIGGVHVDNIHFCYFCIKNAKASDYKQHPYNPPKKCWKSALTLENCYKLSYNKQINETNEERKGFLDKFFLYFRQPNTNEIKFPIEKHCEIHNATDILKYVDRFFEKEECWQRGLSKEIFETEVLRIRLMDYIVQPKNVFELNCSQTALWNSLTLKHDVTIIKAEANLKECLYGCVAQTLNRLLNNTVDSNTFMTNNLDTNIINTFKKLFDDNSGRVAHWIDPPATLRLLIIELWKCGELPIIVRSDGVLPVLKKYKHLKKRYIIITKNLNSKREECDSYQLKMFTHVNDVKCLAEGDELLKTILVSLQGREPITLQSIVNHHEELAATLSCAHIIHLMKPRKAYLSKECLDGDNDLLFLIEDVNSTAEYSLDSINRENGNIEIRCPPEDIDKYRERIKQTTDLKNYEIFHCASSLESENFTVKEGEKSLLKDFFVDQDGESVYVLGNNPIPIVGPNLKSIQRWYISRFLRSAVVSTSIFDSQTKAICFISGELNYLGENLRTRLMEAPKNMEFEEENMFIDIKDEDVEKYWEKASNLKRPLLHIRVDGNDMHLCKYKNWKGLNNHISYSGRQIPEKNVLTEVTEGITILSGEPGIGKSSLLHSLFKNCDTNKYTLFYNLVDYACLMAKRRLLPTNISIDFLLELSKNKRYKEFVSVLFGNKDRVLVLLDSFDEVLPAHKDNVVRFIRNLAASKVQIIIASRTIATYILISNFETRILKVDCLGVNDSENYIKNCGLNEQILTTIPDEFLQNPLYLNLLKTISENNVNLEHITKLSLFEQIVKIKIKQYFERYVGNMYTPMEERYLEPVRNVHFHLALMRILGRNIVNELLPVKRSNELPTELKLGLVLSIDKEGYPTFVHETFAEYLTADWIVRNKKKKTAKKIYQEMINQKKLYVLDILCEHLKLHNAVLRRNISEIELYANDCSQLVETDGLGRMAIHIAAVHYDRSSSLIEILIQCIRQHNLDFTASDNLMEWDWVQHINGGNVIDLELCNSFPIAAIKAYLNCIVKKLKAPVQLRASDDSNSLMNKMYIQAVKNGSIDMIRDLFSINDAMPNKIAMTEKLTQLHVKCINGSIKEVRDLIKLKHEVNATDNFGCTPLHYAIMNPPDVCIDMTKVLLENGSKLDIVNCNGDTAIKIALLVGNSEVTTLLIQVAFDRHDRNMKGLLRQY